MEEGTNGALPQAHEERQIFIRPTRRNMLELVAWVVGLPYLVIFVMWLDGAIPLFSPPTQIFLWSPVVTVPMAVLVGLQRVIIEGTTIRFMTLRTLFRWRSFDAGEVRAIRCIRGGDTGYTLEMSLVAAPHRRWNTVWFSSLTSRGRYYRGIDVPLFLACVHAVARIQPTLGIEGLPEGYAGAMPLPALTRTTDSHAVQAGAASAGRPKKRMNNRRSKR